MPKVLLFRASDDLKARLISEFARAGYEISAPERTDVQTVLEQKPDLILLQTDVKTLDCCGLISELKGNEASATVKILLLAHGGPLERSRALDLGADDVLSIPFESAELFARVRAQLREKAPDDRLRSEARDAKRKEMEAEAALASIITEKESGKKRWLALWLLIVVVAIGAGIAVRNAQVSSKSNAKLALQMERLQSEVVTERQLLERAQKSREVLDREEAGSVNKQLAALRTDSAELRNRVSTSSGATLSDLDSRLKETDSRIGKLESESRIAQQIVRDYSNSVCLIHAVLGFYDKKTGAQLKFAGTNANGDPEVDESGNAAVTTEGKGRPVHIQVFGTGFLVDSAGHILTNHHVLEPWWHNADAIPVPADSFETTVLSLRAYFPGNDTPLPLRVEGLREDFDLGLASVSLPKNHPKPVTIDKKGATSGSAIVLIGYPTGLDGILARIDETTLKQIAQASGHNTEDLVLELARRKLIRPITTQGHLGVVAPDRLVYDAQTTSGGSGGPVFNTEGKVIGVNFAMLTGFSGSNFAVPISLARKMLETPKSAKAGR
jgi:DNA-binding response OmpR family regulator/S1-C subfamily serine protease